MKIFLPDFPFSSKNFTFFYGWMILFVSTMAKLASLPGHVAGICAFIEPLMSRLCISRNGISTIYAICSILSVSFLPFFGSKCDRIGPRKALTITLASFGFSMLLLGLILSEHIPLIHLSKILNITILSLGVFALKFFGQNLIPMFSRIILLNWFEKKKCIMLGISGIFLSIGFGIAPSLFNSLIDNVGIEFSWIIIAGLILLVFTPIIWLFGRDHPAQFALTLDGGESNEKICPDKDIYQAIKSPAFWLFTLAGSMVTLLGTGIQFHVVDIFREFGYEKQNAFNFFKPVSLVSALMSLIFSWLQDKVSLKYGLMLSFLIQILLLTTLEFGKTDLAYYPLVFFMGCNYGMYTIMLSAPWARLFGRKHLGNIIGFVSLSVSIFNAVSPYLMSLSKSIFSTYLIATRCFMVLAIILFLASIFFTKASDMD
ncbi:MAG: MFS transporter [Puniceicoccales bacterium]|nr:MFS transporter [Puniceicoccales bacterium]